MLLLQPHRLLADGWPAPTAGPAAPLLFAVAYGLCAAALAPRPVLNLAAGVLFGAVVGTAVALAGTVLAAGLSFALGRLLGQEALRSLLRGQRLRQADRQLSRHGFRAVLLMRLVPGVPFAVANYGAAVSRMHWLPFLAATGLGSVPNTSAYAVAGSHATSPDSPAFVSALAFLTLTGLGTAYLGWRRRARGGTGHRAVAVRGGTAALRRRCGPAASRRTAPAPAPAPHRAFPTRSVRGGTAAASE